MSSGRHTKNSQYLNCMYMHTYNPNIGCVVRLEGWNSNENEAKKEKKRKKLRRRRGLEPVGAREKERELCQATTGSLAEFPNLHLWSKLFKSVTHYRNSWLKMAPNFCSFEKKSSCPKEIGGAAMERGVACSPWRNQSWATKFYGHVMGTKLSYSGHPGWMSGQCSQRSVFEAPRGMLL